jgi:hypothetical protein
MPKSRATARIERPLLTAATMSRRCLAIEFLAHQGIQEQRFFSNKLTSFD